MSSNSIEPLSERTYKITHEGDKPFVVHLDIADISYAISTLIKEPADCKPIAVQMKVISYDTNK